MKPRRSGISGFSRDLDNVDKDVVLTLSEAINKYETLYRYAPALREEDFAKELKKHDAMLEKSLQNVKKEQLMFAILQLLKNDVKGVDYESFYDIGLQREVTFPVYSGDVNIFDNAEIIEKILLGANRKLMVTIIAELLNMKTGSLLIEELETRVGNRKAEDIILDARNLYAEIQPQLNAERLFGERKKEQAAKQSKKDEPVVPSLGHSPRKK